jgi:Ca2+-binding RTX toxin-like protein
VRDLTARRIGTGSHTGEATVGSRAAIGQATAPGDHLVRAGAGNDTVIPGQGNDTVQGGPGDDLIHGYGGDGVSSGHTVSNWLNDGADALAGASGNDTILGYGGSDRMDGGPGDDLLKGGPDADILTGGPGADTFQFGFLAPSVYLGYTPDSGVGWGIRDTITDFRPGVDRIDLKGYGGATDLRIEPLGDGLLLRFDAHAAGRAVPQEIELGPASAVFRFFHKAQGTHFYTPPRPSGTA